MSNRRSPSTLIRELSDLTPDPRNANLGTPRGRRALQHSLREYGAGRAVLIDRHGMVIAMESGHRMALAAEAIG